MATLILMVGLPGSGKTTVAKQLEMERSAVRLTPDEWITPLFGKNLPQEDLDRVRNPVETVQWAVAARALRLGIDVILDYGFWTRQEREDFRARAAALGVRSEIRYLDVPHDDLTQRLFSRAQSTPSDTFPVTEAQLQSWAREFEKPGPDEIEPREPG